MKPTSARSRRPTSLPASIESRSCRASAALRTVLSTPCYIFGAPRTAAAGFTGNTWPTTSQSNSIRRAARCCFTVGRMGFSEGTLYKRTKVTGPSSASPSPRSSQQAKNCPTARAYARRVFLFLIIAVKHSMKHRLDLWPAAAIIGGSPSKPARTVPSARLRLPSFRFGRPNPRCITSPPCRMQTRAPASEYTVPQGTQPNQ